VSGVEFEDREVRLLSADLMAAAAEAPEETRKVVQKGALNIKTDARRRVSSIAHAPTYPLTITYDTEVSATGASAEIGPDKDKKVGGGKHQTPGDLGHLFEFGGPHNAPIPHMAPAAAAELPRFEKAMTDLAERLLGDQ
jgi:hypothetical protein